MLDNVIQKLSKFGVHIQVPQEYASTVARSAKSNIMQGKP